MKKKVIIFTLLTMILGGVAIAVYMMPEQQDYTVVSDDKMSIADAEKKNEMQTDEKAEDDAEYMMIGDQKWTLKSRKYYGEDYTDAGPDGDGYPVDESTYITIDERAVEEGEIFTVEEVWSYTDENGQEQIQTRGGKVTGWTVDKNRTDKSTIYPIGSEVTSKQIYEDAKKTGIFED